MAELSSSEEVSTKSTWSVLHLWTFTCSHLLLAISKYSLVKLPFSYSSDIQCNKMWNIKPEEEKCDSCGRYLLPPLLSWSNLLAGHGGTNDDSASIFLCSILSTICLAASVMVFPVQSVPYVMLLCQFVPRLHLCANVDMLTHH